jgi:hypothetical protein
VAKAEVVVNEKNITKIMGKDIFLIDVLFFFKAIFEYKSTQTGVYLKLRISVVGKNGVRLDEPHFGLGSDLVIFN